jgi:hypothetical protein
MKMQTKSNGFTLTLFMHGEKINGIIEKGALSGMLLSTKNDPMLFSQVQYLTDGAGLHERGKLVEFPQEVISRFQATERRFAELID